MTFFFAFTGFIGCDLNRASVSCTASWHALFLCILYCIFGGALEEEDDDGECSPVDASWTLLPVAMRSVSVRSHQAGCLAPEESLVAVRMRCFHRFASLAASRCACDR